MADYTGHASFMGFGPEATWGTGVLPTQYLPILSETLVLDDPPIISQAVTASAARKRKRTGTKSVGGDIMMDVPYQNIASLFYHLLGAKSTAQVGATAAYDHTITPADAMTTGLSFEMVRGGVGNTGTFRYEGSKINSLALEMTPAELVKATWGVLCEDEQVNPVATVAAADTRTDYTIGDSGESYTVDEHIGRTVEITAGTGVGQTRLIVDNDATTVTVAKWTVTPDVTSSYVIYATSPDTLSADKYLDSTIGLASSTTIGKENVAWGINEHAGRVMNITGGTGAAQLRIVASNTADTLTVTVAFDVTPDATSDFEIYIPNPVEGAWDPYTFHEVDFKLNTYGNAPASIECLGASLNIGNGLKEDKFTLNSRTRAALPRNQHLMVNGTFRMEYDDNTQYARYAAGTELALQIKLLASQGVVAARYMNSSASLAGASAIGKTGAGWGVNDHQNRLVKIISGTGVGDIQTIASNTADTITTSAPFATQPDATSDFEIYEPSTYYTITIDMPRCILVSAPINITGPELIEMELAFEAFYDVTGSNPEITAVVRDGASAIT